METPLVPINEDINEIEDNLFMGNLETACNSELIHKYRIKKILSVLQTKIPDKYIIEGIQYKYINVWDSEHEDIISYFPECFDFILSGQNKKENVLVHCRAGRSRSAAIIIAYMMKKYGYNLKTSLQRLTNLRNEISPNFGFQKQLKLWQKMNFMLLGSDPEYRLVLVAGLKNRVKIIKRFGQNESWKICLDALKSAFICYLQKVLNAENNCHSLQKGNTFLCKNCSNKLFQEINLVKSPEVSSTNTTRSTTCSSIFIEPQKWILNRIISTTKSLKDMMSGQIHCIQCKELLGSYKWYKTGYSCDCSSHKQIGYHLVIKIDCNKLKQ